MFSFNKLKELRTESENSNRYESDLNVLFYVIKYAHEINLEVINKDKHKNNWSYSVDRTLKLDGFLVNICEGVHWTINITLVNKNKSLTVAEMQIPNVNVNWFKNVNFVTNCLTSKYRDDWNWDSDENSVSNYTTLKWSDEGSWCKIIYEKINSIKNEIENKKIDKEMEEQKEKIIEEQERNKDKLYFENIFKLK